MRPPPRGAAARPPRPGMQMLRAWAPLLMVLARAKTVFGRSIPQAELDFLRSFYEETGGPHWLDQTGWADAVAANWEGVAIQPCPNASGPVWTGIESCDEDGRISALNFAPGGPMIERGCVACSADFKLKENMDSNGTGKTSRAIIVRPSSKE